MKERSPNFIEKLTTPGRVLWLLTFLLVCPIHSRGADPIATAEAAIASFRAACNGEIKQAVSPETMKRITVLCDAPFLMVARKSHVDVTEFIDPKVASALSHDPFYGSQEILTKSTGDVWVLTYGNMSSLTIYLEAASGKILCVAFIPEG
ncbi:MAG TPA: hypothetical protein VGM54_21320 [Chthoniobacter sp.]|jgi:hypothetical protein